MTVIGVPERTMEQRMRSLRLANEVRLHMADRRRELKSGGITLDEVLDDPRCGSMYVAQALQAIPRVGRGKADRVLRRSGVSLSKKVGALTDRQRTAILAEVGYFPSARKALL